jgi:adenosylmethionine-8-amino-7-oxononanoate aminotransferase
MSKVLYRHNVSHDLPRAVGGDGAWIIDAAGKRYLDASGGAAVSCLGHSNEAIRAALVEQVSSLAYAHTRYFTTDAMEEMADLLVSAAPDALSKVWFTSGGSEAIEAALKITRQYFVEIGQADRRFVIGRRQGYHGSTTGALSAGGNAWRRRVFEPILLGTTHHIGPCYPYRHQRADETIEAYGRRTADELEAKIQELGPGNVAAFMAETVVGSSIGTQPPAPGYFKRIREICDTHGVLLILDEVMCGMGRTGTRFAFEQEGIVPDMVALAKGLSAGYAPFGALLLADKIHRAIENGSKAVMHGHTFMGHALGCTAALAAQRYIDDNNLLEAVRERGAYLERKLKERFGQHPNVGDIRGRGLFWSLELVSDRNDQTPFPQPLGLSNKIKDGAMENGLICYPMGGVADGRQGDVVMLAPPFIVTEAEIDLIVDKLAQTLDTVLAKATVEVAA